MEAAAASQPLSHIGTHTHARCHRAILLLLLIERPWATDVHGIMMSVFAIANSMRERKESGSKFIVMQN